MPEKESIKHYIDTSEPSLAQIGDEWWNTGTGKLYKKVLTRGGVGWTEIMQPTSIETLGNNSVTWNSTQTFNTKAIFDKSESAFVSSFSVGSNPVAMAIQGKYLYVLNTGGTNKFEIYDISIPSLPTLISSMTPSSITTTATNFVISGNIAYIIGSGQKIWTIDISSPGIATEISSITLSTLINLTSIGIQGQYAYIAAQGSSKIGVINIANKANPFFVSSLQAFSGINKIFIYNKWIFASSYSGNTVWAVDISDPYAIAQINSLQTLVSNPSGLDSDGKYLYVANAGRNELFTIDFSYHPAVSFVKSSSITNNLNSPRSVSIQGKYAYIANNGINSVSAINIYSPTDMQHSYSLSYSINAPTQIIAKGKYLYVLSAGNSTIQIYNTSFVFTQSLEAGTIDASSAHFQKNVTINQDAEIKGSISIAKGADITGNVGITGTISAPAAKEIGLFKSITTQSFPMDLLVHGRYIYVANYGAQTVQIFDTSNNNVTQSSPVINLNTISVTNPTCLASQGQYLYVSQFIVGQKSQINIYNISNPIYPTLVNTFFSGINTLEMSVQGNYMASVGYGDSSIQITDISDPMNPTVLSVIKVTNAQFRSCKIQGIYLYVADESGSVKIYSIANPYNPVLLSDTPIGQVLGLAVQGTQVCVVLTYGICVLQTTNPNNPTISPISNASVSSANYGIEVQGRYAYTFSYQSNSSSINIFDISQCNTSVGPVKVGIASTTYASFKGRVSGRFLYVANYASTGPAGLEIFDIGGAFIHNLESGSIEVGTLQARNNAIFNSNIDVKGSVLSNSLTVNGTANIQGTSNVYGNSYAYKFIQQDVPFVANNISNQFNGTKNVFDIKRDQSPISSIVPVSGKIVSIVSTATQFVVTHSLGTFVPGSTITITNSSTSGYNNNWTVLSSTSTTCTILTNANLASSPTIAGYVAGYLSFVVDSKDVEVMVNGNYLDPYISENRLPWFSEYDLIGQFKVSGSKLILYNTPSTGDKAMIKVNSISKSAQIRRYPFSSAAIGLGE